jgi:trehalose-6-phosphate synthase
MDREERRLRATRLREIVRERDPERWIAEQLADIESRRTERA